MNILEILDTNISSSKSNNSFKYRTITSPETTKHGAYGRAHGIQDDPHLMKKKPHDPFMQKYDGYYNYILYIAKNKIAESNPFAPRVYDIKTVEDAHGRMKYSIKLEKLTKITEFDNELVYQIGYNLYGEYFYSYVRKNKVQDEGLPVPELSHTLRALNYIIRDTCMGKISSKNKKLNRLCQIIGKLAEDTRSQIDIHTGNYMIRMSPTPQLVIVDPLA